MLRGRRLAQGEMGAVHGGGARGRHAGVSLPQPTHYDFAETGQIVDFLIFAGGAVLQLVLISAVALFALRSRKT